MAGLTVERLREVLNYNPETGEFSWAIFKRKVRAGMPAGALHKASGYKVIGIDWGLYKAHRLAWMHVYGYMPSKDIDHINGDRSDNRIANLREATMAENLQNQRRARVDNKSGMLGVHWNKTKWRACIRVNGKTMHLGGYSTPEEAHAAYLDGKARLHPFSTISNEGVSDGWSA